jgi:hypothetical protein
VRRTVLALTVIAAAAAAIVLYARSKGPPPSPGIDESLARTVLTRAPITGTDAGLSGLAIDDDGVLWTLSERTHVAFRIRLDGEAIAEVVPVPIDGAIRGTDLESIAWLGGGRFAFGTEAHVHGRATVLLATLKGGRLVVDDTIDLPSSLLGVEVRDNAGAEGVCGTGTIVLAAIETTGEASGRRFAPIARVDLASGTRTVYRVWLTSPTGKLAAIDCRVLPDGTARVLAIERHFEVSRILELEVPAAGARDIDPRLVTDLSPIIRGSLNLEGVVWRADGRMIVINDSQSGGEIVAQSQLLLFKAPMGQAAKALAAPPSAP